MTSTQPPGARQLHLLDGIEIINYLDARLWRGSFNARESSLQQLAPYVGKMKSGMARAIIGLYSKPGDTILDPFSGSGIVPMEAVLCGRRAVANDLNPYAYALTRGKLESPKTMKTAMERAKALVDMVECQAPTKDLSLVPQWVREFFHLNTLREILTAFEILKSQEDYFLISCLLGILHHIRPGFLSYPASHLVPYLRTKKYPPRLFPRMYSYRDLRSRLLAKVKRAYRRPMLPLDWDRRQFEVWCTNSMNLPIKSEAIDSIISSPPYFGALDYARDNRLRLWFLGIEDWKRLDRSLTANSKVYLPQMAVCLKEMYRVLKRGRHCVLVLGDVERNGETTRTAEILGNLAGEVGESGFSIELIYDDRIPDERRSRRRTRTTKFERILVMRKKS